MSYSPMEGAVKSALIFLEGEVKNNTYPFCYLGSLTDGNYQILHIFARNRGLTGSRSLETTIYVVRLIGGEWEIAS